MRSTRWLTAASAALLLGGLPAIVAVPGGASSNDTVKAALFYDTDYVDTSTGGGGEAYNVKTTLTERGAAITLIEGIDATDFTTGLAGMPDVLVIPELEKYDEGSESSTLGTDMSPEARSVVKTWVEAGGRIEVFGSSDPWPTVNAIFGTSIITLDDSNCGGDDGEPPLCTITTVGQGTEFSDGPATLGYNNDTGMAADPATLPAGSKTIYVDSYSSTPGVAGINVIPFGHGSLVFFAFDWFGTQDGPGGEPKSMPMIAEGFDPGWFDALEQSLSVKASVNDVAVLEGATAQFTVTLDETPSQDVVFTYSTADGTAADGTDYTASTGTVFVAAGSTSVTVDVPTLARPGTQGIRVFTLNLDAPYWGLMADGAGTGTIDDAAAPTTTVPVVQAVAATPKFTG